MIFQLFFDILGPTQIFKKATLMDRKLGYAHVILGFVILWTMFFLLLPPRFEPPKPFPELIPAVQTSGFHDAGYEDAWIQFIDEEERLVQVQAVESRIVIVFRLKRRQDLARYHEGYITPITPRCVGGGTDCDIGSQEKLYAGNVEVQPVIWKTYGSNKKLKIKQY